MAKKPGVDMTIAVAPSRKDLSAPGPLEAQKQVGDEPEPKPDGDEGALTHEDVDYSDNDLCGSCAHNQEAQCAKYGFQVDDTGHCEAGFEAKGEDGAPEGEEAPEAPTERYGR